MGKILVKTVMQKKKYFGEKRLLLYHVMSNTENETKNYFKSLNDLFKAQSWIYFAETSLLTPPCSVCSSL